MTTDPTRSRRRPGPERDRGKRREQRHRGEDEPRAPALHAVPAPVACRHGQLHGEYRAWRRPRRVQPASRATRPSDFAPAQTNSSDRGPEKDETPVGSDQKPPETVEPGVGEAVVRVAAEQSAEAEPLEPDPESRAGLPRRWPRGRARVGSASDRRKSTSGSRTAGRGHDQAALGEHGNPGGEPGAERKRPAAGRQLCGGQRALRGPAPAPRACIGSENSSSAYEPSGDAIDARSTAATTSRSPPPRRRAMAPAAAAAMPTASQGTIRKSACELPAPSRVSNHGAAHAAGTCSRLVAMP